ncbi:lysozyme inhibitor LprI family protein [Flavobacterium sp.]|uniref:lysozyme inhibitor LprI family protein n=1 Tax=Flavobacterium sp. TaxID=239 RepID=UPI003D6A5897
MKKLLLGVLVLFSISGFSQTLKTVKELEKANQDCLDQGKNMLGCSRDYYEQMDALLNKVYNKLRTSLTAEEKAKLKKEQQLWLKKRDKYADEQYDETAELLEGETESQDFKMIVRHSEAEFVKERVIVLIKRL